MRIVQAKERFSKTLFTTSSDWPKYPPSFYRCGNCSFEIAFFMADFARHDRSDFTNLTEVDDRRMTASITQHERAAALRIYNSFLDFYCPQCTRAIRVYFIADELVASVRRIYGYSIGFVVEDEE